MNAKELSRLQSKLEFMEQKANRWDWLCANAKLGFSSAPGWNAVITIPAYDPAGNTIEQIVDAGIAYDK